MSMNGPVAAEEQDDVSLSECGHAQAPLNAGIVLKTLKVFGRTSQPENRCRPHGGDESSRIPQRDTGARTAETLRRHGASPGALPGIHASEPDDPPLDPPLEV